MKVIVNKQEMAKFLEFEYGPSAASNKLATLHSDLCGQHTFGPIPFMGFKGQRKDGTFKSRKAAENVVLGWHRIVAAMTARKVGEMTTFQVSTAYATK